jgi:N-acetylgalactosamine-N,N'-diacetylbacillosaminyl-diphospho-undecaprenol 4-alpha-N-acetylgalactosaminyltransferase
MDWCAVTGRKRILFLINSLTGGGAERVMCTLLHHSKQECAEFDVTLGLLDVESQAYAPPDWVNVRQLDARKSFGRSLLEARKLFAEVQPDISISFLTRSNVANALCARGGFILSERANTSAHFAAGPGGALQRAVIRALYPRATRIIAVSEGVGEDLRDNFAVRADRIVAIPNPVDVDAIAAKAALAPELSIEAPYIMAAGRLVRSKNFDVLIRAFAASGRSGKLLIVGEGPQREALLETARECGVADRVLMPGFVSNPYPLMRAADLFVLSSRAEGFPNALVEAMAVGAPVVAANCRSGPSEILAETNRDSITSLTFAQHGVVVPEDAPEAMAEALRAMQDPKLREDYGKKAAQRALAYGATRAKDRYWDVIRAALAERGVGHGRRS